MRIDYNSTLFCVVNGDVEQEDFIDNSITEEEDERCHPPLKEPPQVRKTNCTYISKTTQDENCVYIVCVWQSYLAELNDVHSFRDRK